MAAPVLQAQGSTVLVTTGAPALTIPAHVANDIIIIVAEFWGPVTAGDAAQIPTPTGSITYTLLGTQGGQPSAANRDGWSAVFWGRADSAGETVTLTRGASWDTGTDTSFAARAYIVRNCVQTGNPFSFEAKSGPHTTANQAFAALTGSGGERSAIIFGNSMDNAALPMTASGWTTGTEDNDTGGTDATFQTARQENITTGTSGDTSTATAPAQGAYYFHGALFTPQTAVLDAGSNTITLTANAQSQLVAISLEAGANTITLTAGDAELVVPSTTLQAGSNTITVSANVVPAVDLTIPQLTNTIALTANAQSQLVDTPLAAGSNTITISNPAVVETYDIDLYPGWDRIRGSVGHIVFNNISGRIEGTDGNSGTVACAVLLVGPTGDQEITAIANDVSSPPGDCLAVALRGTSAPSFYMFRRANATTVEMFRFNSGTATNIANFTRATTAGIEHTFRFRAVTTGSSVELEAQIDGTAICTFSDTSGSRLTGAGTPGIAFLPDDAGAYIRNIVVTDLLFPDTNTITITAPAVQGVHLTIPQDTNTITITAPDAELVVAGGGDTLAAGVQTITILAPDVPAVHLTIPQTTNTINVTAPAQTELHAITLAAGSNTITITANAQAQIVAVSLAAGSNTITLTANAQTEIHAVSLAAGVQSISITAPTVPAVHLTIPQLTNTISVTAPEAEGVFAGGPLNAGQNIITITAPTVPAVHLTIPQQTNTVTVTAPAQSQLVETFLAATANTVVVSAPVSTLITDTAREAGSNTITVEAPTAQMFVDQNLTADTNTILVTAPDAVMALTFDTELSAGTQVVFILAPTMTFQPTYPGLVKQRHEARFTQNQPQTAKVQVLAPEEAGVIHVVLSTESVVQ